MAGTPSLNPTALTAALLVAARRYAFMLLVLIVAQMSILWEVYRNLDSSFTDQIAQVLNGLCYASAKAATASEAAGSLATELAQAADDGTSGQNNSWAPAGLVDPGTEFPPASANDTRDVLDDLAVGAGDGIRTVASVVEQSSQALRELCECSALSVPRHCISDWVARQWKYALGLIGLLFAFEGMCAILAWSFVEELDHERLEAKQQEKEKRQYKLNGKQQKANTAPGWGVVSQSLQKITTLSEPVLNKAQHEVRLPLVLVSHIPLIPQNV